VVAATLIAAACAASRPAPHPTSDPALPLRSVGEIAVPGDNSRFDYSSIDRQRGLLFIAHLGATEVVEVDVQAGRLVAHDPDLTHVHGAGGRANERRPSGCWLPATLSSV
jgi:hypothetical protein